MRGQHPVNDHRNIPGENLEFLVVGLNHRTAPVEIRERLALNKEQLPDALNAQKNLWAKGGLLRIDSSTKLFQMPSRTAGFRACRRRFESGAT